MKNNLFIKILCSIPVILLFLYFIPFLGVCLILFRYFIYDNKKRIETPIYLIVCGVIILIPKLILSISSAVKYEIPYFNDIFNSELYSINFIKYSKLLITVGVIFLILSFIFNSLFNKIKNYLHTSISSYEQRTAKIQEKNDLIMKEKQMQAKNTHVVICSHCGASNMLTSTTGKCKYCRNIIQ